MSLDRNIQRLGHFPGGIDIPEEKSESRGRPIGVAPLPERLIIPMLQHVGEPAIPCVHIGDRVLRGQVIGCAPAGLGAPVHASTSGRIIDIGDYAVPHPSWLKMTCVVIEADGDDTLLIGDEPVNDCHAVTPEQVRERIHKAGLVGLGGAAFPTGRKIYAGDHLPLHTLVINGAECEPYISCDDMVMRERPEQVILGARVIAHALRLKRCVIGVEDCQQEAIAALRRAGAEIGADDIEIIDLPSLYPAGGERQLIKVLTNQSVPERGLPQDIGIICQNVGTAVAAYQAICQGKALTARVVTVTGAGVAAPQNLDTRIGTPFATLIEACGGYTSDVERLIMGGPMMGLAVPSDDLPVIKATNCVLVAGKADLGQRRPADPCIRCGECARVCPESLLPQQLYWHTRAQDWDKVEDHHIFSCIECGCCAYVCPSHIPLVDYYRHAKAAIRARARDRQIAEHARARHEAREARLEREQAERAARMDRKRAAIKKP